MPRSAWSPRSSTLTTTPSISNGCESRRSVQRSQAARASSMPSWWGRLGRGREAELGEPTQRFPMGVGRDRVVAPAELVDADAQRAGCGDRGVLLSHRPRRRVARIGVERQRCTTFSPPFLVLRRDLRVHRVEGRPWACRPRRGPRIAAADCPTVHSARRRSRAGWRSRPRPRGRPPESPPAPGVPRS